MMWFYTENYLGWLPRTSRMNCEKVQPFLNPRPHASFQSMLCLLVIFYMLPQWTVTVLRVSLETAPREVTINMTESLANLLAGK